MGAYSSNMQTSIKLALGLCLLLALTNFAAASEGVELAKTDPLCEKVTKETALDTWCTEGFCSFCIVDVPGKASGAYCLYKCQEGELGKGVDLSDDPKKAVEERAKGTATGADVRDWRNMPMSEEEEELQKDAVVPEKLIDVVPELVEEPTLEEKQSDGYMPGYTAGAHDGAIAGDKAGHAVPMGCPSPFNTSPVKPPSEPEGKSAEYIMGYDEGYDATFRSSCKAAYGR